MQEETAPNYSLFFEIAVAIGGALLVLLFCNGRKAKKREEGDSHVYVKSEVSDGNNNEQRSDTVRKRVRGSDNGAVKGLIENDTKQEKLKEVDNVTCEPELTKASVSNDDISRAQSKICSEVKERTQVTYAARATQTETLEVDDARDEPRDTSDMAIMWRGVLVNGDESTCQMRYRTELHMKMDGAITHCESFRKEGFVGSGIDQVLIKVQ